MARSGTFPRYLLFLSGVIFTALGISLITLSGMGTSAVSSLAYVLTYLQPALSFGVASLTINLLMFLGQILILGRRFAPIQLLQVPATVLFSMGIDLWMALLAPLVPGSYAGRWVVLLLGCVVLGFGVAQQVVPDVLILPCEGIVRAASQTYGWDFGKTKTCYDVGMVSTAALLSLLGLGKICGLREGTLVCALITGTISRFFCRRLAPVAAAWRDTPLA